jgi:alkaline phosphatase D
MQTVVLSPTRRSTIAPASPWVDHGAVPRPIAPAVPGHTVTRRGFLGGLAAGVLAASGLTGCAEAPNLPDLAGRDPFSLGVAAGDPVPDGFVLWTRVAPDPLWPDPAAPGGLTAGDVTLRYDIASDPGMRTIVQSGSAVAEAAYAHSVHLEVRGLEAGRPYWYRFTGGGAQSRIGRAWTAPPPGQPLGRLRFGFVSCANYEHGYFAAYRHLADQSPDLVLYLGDYIYEFIERARPTVRRHSDDVEATTLPTYRNRYAQYRLDSDLQRLHAETPALVTWDDHEVQDDYAGQWSKTFDDPAVFLQRRAAAYQAFYEHMPLRPSLSRPRGPDLRLYDRFAYGDLVEFSMLDERQYRSREACARPPNAGGGHLEFDSTCKERKDPSRSILGAPQEAWLFDGLARSQARWNVLAQGVLMAQLRQRVPLLDIVGHWTDAWDGYPASRDRLLAHLEAARVSNPVVISGDLHSFWVNDLKKDFDDPGSPTVATEFVGTSISSLGPSYSQFMSWMPDNPHVQFFDSRQRGYVFVELTPERMTTYLRALSDVRDKQATVSTLRSYVVESGRPGAIPA